MLLADAYIHQLDPYAIEAIGIRWYGLAYATGFLIAWLIVRWFMRTGRSTLAPEALGDLLFISILGVLLGGRLGYVLFYDPSLITDFSSSVPWWGVLAINRGGMSSHGGIVGVIIALTWFGYRRGVSPLHLLDMGAFACLPGLCLGRIANFINAELWGRALPGDMQASPPWWSVKYPTEPIEVWQPILSRPDLYDDAVVQNIASRWQAMEALAPQLPGEGPLVHRVIEAAYAGNDVVLETLRPLLTAYYPSQLLQALTDGPILMGLLAIIWWRPRKPGVVGAWFAIGYGVLRIATEAVRQPDVGVATLATPLGELSRGQQLSVLMVLVGLILLVICSRRAVPRLGGLLRTEPREPAAAA